MFTEGCTSKHLTTISFFCFQLSISSVSTRPMPTSQMVSSYIEAYFNFKTLQVLITSFSVHEPDACTDESMRDEQPELPERDECRYPPTDMNSQAGTKVNG